jgi:hypothetical protein
MRRLDVAAPIVGATLAVGVGGGRTARPANTQKARFLSGLSPVGAGEI